MEHEIKLNIEDKPFDEMRAATNTILQRLFDDMVNKGSNDAKVGITISINLSSQFLSNRVDEELQVEDRISYTPKIKYKVGSQLTIKNDVDGTEDYDGYELRKDEETGQYVIVPITGQAQQSFFDAEYKEIWPDGEDVEAVDEPAQIGSTRKVLQLEDKSSEETEEAYADEYSEDTDEDTVEEIPFSDEDVSEDDLDTGYEYEEAPEEDE